MESWDLIIIGAGPAGLTAGIYAGRSGLKTLLLEEKTAGGELAMSPWIENYPGSESISGAELTEKMVKQCRKFGAQINELEKVVALDLSGEEKLVKTEKGSYCASALIVATGTHHRLLNVPGENELQGKGVSYCSLCDGPFFRGKKVHVIGGGNAAAMSANHLSHIAANVKLVHRRSRLRAEAAAVEAMKQRNVEFLLNTVVKEIRGDSAVRSVILENKVTGEIRELKVDGIFVQIGEEPSTRLVREAGVAVDKDGYVVVDACQETNVPGVFAAGDVTNGPVKQVVTAVGRAAVAATEAFGHIRRPYYHKR